MGKQSKVEATQRREAVLSLLRKEVPGVALARRYGVSEATLYRWRDDFITAGAAALSDVDWAGGRFIVRSSKTEHHEGKATRVVPIFPELLPHLREVFEQAERGTVNVITRYRDANADLRTQLERIIRRAGLSSWPKLFQNLKASRATELANEFPAHVAAAWLGHSTLVANMHYWQVTQSDFAQATAAKVDEQRTTTPTRAEAAQNPAQSAHDTRGNEVQRETAAHEKPLILSGFDEFAEGF